MSFLDRLKKIVASPSKPSSADALFVYVKIPEAIMPIDRGARFEDPLDAALRKAHVGEVSGGGSQLSAPDQNGARQIVFCGIDVDLSKRDEGLVLLRSELIRLNAPRGTVLQYTVDGEKHEDAVYES